MKAIVADDHAVVHLGIKLILQKMGMDVCILSDVKDILLELKKGLPDLLVCDIEFQDQNSLAIITRALDLYPSLKVIIYSKHASGSIIDRYTKLGVRGFVNKLSDLSEMEEAISTVLANKRYLDKISTNAILDKSQLEKRLSELTPREYDFFLLLAKDYNYQEIAKIANVNTSTVGSYRTRISSKLDLHSRQEMREFATFIGLIV